MSPPIYYTSIFLLVNIMYNWAYQPIFSITPTTVWYLNGLTDDSAAHPYSQSADTIWTPIFGEPYMLTEIYRSASSLDIQPLFGPI